MVKITSMVPQEANLSSTMSFYVILGWKSAVVVREGDWNCFSEWLVNEKNNKTCE